jgi:5'-deoxynucleotidase YfbR-like HD superfamily hydrolase
MSIHQLLDSGQVLRYHVLPSSVQQNVAAHSWGVAMLYNHICPKPTIEGMRYALEHDCHEILTGDIPAHVKRADPETFKSLKELEARVEHELGVCHDIDDKDRRWVKLSDLLELVWWGAERVYRGDKAYRVVVERGIQYILDGFCKELQESPNAAKFLSNVKGKTHEK